MRDHLEVCARCLEAERMARAIPLMLSSSLDPPPPPTLLPSLLSGLGRSRRRERRAALAAALVLVLACAALVGLRSRTEPERRSNTPATAVAPAALVASGHPAASFGPGRPATLGAAPSATRTLTPQLKVSRLNMPNPVSLCPAKERSGTAGVQTVTCQTQTTPKRPNRP